MLFSKTKINKGFTLIELLVVISIIALLSSVIAVSVQDARNKGKVAKVKADFVQIRNAAELYKNDKGTYPANITDLVPQYLATATVNPFYVWSAAEQFMETCFIGTNGYKISTESENSSGCGFCGSSANLTEKETGKFFVYSTANLGSNNAKFFSKFIARLALSPPDTFNLFNGSGSYVYSCLE